MPDLLIELFSEEIPARMQARAADDLKKLVTDGLVEAGLTYASAGAFATPRRLALTVEGLLAESPTTIEDRKGPRADAPDKAIEGFLRGAGLSRDDLEERDTPKGPVLFARIEKPGRAAAEIIAGVLEETIRGFPWPKSMRWGAGSLRWVRPLQSILCILTDESGAEIVPFNIDGIVAGDQTAGHRFMAPERFSVTSFDDYTARLKRAFVMLDAAERADTLLNDANNQAFAGGFEVVEDQGLLSEVAGLVEWPVVLMGRIGDEFLDLPPEVLQTSMKEHQKFFSIRNAKTGRIERFITVANRETKDDGATILAGNEKVLSARLADAKFFWENDLRVAKTDISQWITALENVTFHNKLGTQADLTERMARLAHDLAPMVGADPEEAEEAARLAKADLSSEMVYEFPELQGVMGRYYIAAAGKSEAVAAAAQDHYAPLGPSDDVPTAPVSAAVALAEKIDKLTGFWAIDEKPTGSKDPFALRRAALGVIRIVLENEITLSLSEILQHSFWEPINRSLEMESAALEEKLLEAKHDYDDMFRLISDIAPNTLEILEPSELERELDIGTQGNTDSLFTKQISAIVKLRTGKRAQYELHRVQDGMLLNLLSFLHDRLKVYLHDQGIRHDVIDACIAMPGNDDLALLAKRARALSEVLETDDGENLIQAYRRANNILTQAEEADGVEYSYGADVKFSETDEERALFGALDSAEAIITPALAAQDFSTAMTAMASLRAPVDAFFEAVQVNAENATVRRNRLNLLSRITRTCGAVADLSQIGG